MAVTLNIKTTPKLPPAMKRDYINHVCAPISSTYNTWGLMEDRRKLNGTTPYLGHNLHTVPHISVTNTPYLSVIHCVWQEDILIGMHCTVCAGTTL